MIDPEILAYLNKKAELSSVESVSLTCKAFLSKRNIRKIGNPIQKRKKNNRADVARALRAQNGLCARCGNPLKLKDAQGDHVFALAAGGDSTNFLLQALCKPCNSEKSDRTPLEESKSSGRLFTDLTKGVISK